MRRFTYVDEITGLFKSEIEALEQPETPLGTRLDKIEDITEEMEQRKAAALAYEAQYLAALEKTTIDASGSFYVDMTPTPSLLERAKALLGF
jgi:hypothetical protein